MMRRSRITLFLCCLTVPGAFGLQHVSSPVADPIQLWQAHSWNRPTNTIPRELREFWLRFHESNLCQGIDAVFAFNPSGVEIWCLVEDERSYRRFAEMAASLRPKWRVDLYVTRPSSEIQSLQDNEPPPSLANNPELQRYLGDPVIRTIRNTGATEGSMGDDRLFGDRVLRQRIRMYAIQVLDWQKKLRRLATDLGLLAPAAFGVDAPRDLKARAAAVCIAHAQAMSRLAEKLDESLERALPQVTKKTPDAEPVRPSPACSPIYCTHQLSIMGVSDARQVYRFVYPRRHAVDVADLRDPGILESLKLLRKQAADFERIARK